MEEHGPEGAIAEINTGLNRFRELFQRYDAADQYSDDELVRRLEEMRENVRRRYEVGPTLNEQLDEAVRAENYELAAKLRDRIRSQRKASALPDRSTGN